MLMTVKCDPIQFGLVPKGVCTFRLLAMLIICSVSTVLAGGNLPVKSRVLAGGQAAVEIVADVSGLDSIALIATGYSWGQAVWAEAVLVAEDGSETQLADLKPVSFKVGWGQFTLNKGPDGTGIKVAGRQFSHGIFAHADSKVIYQLLGKYKQFKAWVGVNHTAGNRGKVVFEVRDGTVEILNEQAGKFTPAVLKEIREVLEGTDCFEG